MFIKKTTENVTEENRVLQNELHKVHNQNLELTNQLKSIKILPIVIKNHISNKI